MEALFWMLVACFFGYVFFILPFAGKAPKKINSFGIDRMRNSMPHEIDYDYFNDASGYAISVSDGKIYLCSNGVEKLFDKNDIRSIEKQWVTPGKQHVVGKVGAADAAVLQHMKNKAGKEAYDSSGIFVNVRDIDTPVFQIKFVKDEDMFRSFEIIRQFIDSELKPKSA